jgi:thioredoxin-related protein
MRYLLLVPAFVCTVAASGSTGNDAVYPQIKFFSGSWDDALHEAKAERKLIFLDISTSWCRTCKYMQYTVFTDEKAAAFFNTHFVNVSADGDGDEGHQLEEKYGLQAYPTLYFVNSGGEVMQENLGAMDADELLEWAKQMVPPPQPVKVTTAPEYRNRIQPRPCNAARVVERAGSIAPSAITGKVLRSAAKEKEE